MSSSDDDKSLRGEIVRAGLPDPGPVVWDGAIHRFGRGKACWYVAHEGRLPAAAAGCWRTGARITWRAESGTAMSADDMQMLELQVSMARRSAETERRKLAAEAASRCDEIWAASTEASADHPYLVSHGIGTHGARVTGDGRLLVPLLTVSADEPEPSLSSVQHIAADGTKRYEQGAAVGGAIWWLGSICDAGTIYLAEGFATAAAIHEETGRPCAIAYSAHNLPAACGAVRALNNASELIIVADNDRSGVGASYAHQAAAIHRARVIVMPTQGQDACDYRQAGGDLKALLAPAPVQWLISAAEFVRQPAPLRWLIRDLLPRDALAMIHGESTAGKTFVALDIAASIASDGVDWGGWVTKHGPVVYLAGEGHHGLRKRLALWMQVRGVAPETVAMHVSSSGCDLDSPHGLAHTIEALRQLTERPVCIIVDTLHAFFSGDENSSQDARKLIVSCKALMDEFCCTVMLVHHTGAMVVGRARGSTAWRASVDVELSLTIDEGETTRSLTVIKQKDAEIVPALRVTIDGGELVGWVDEDGEQTRSAVANVSAGEEPVKKPSKRKQECIDRVKMIEMAWIDAGQETAGSSPYISRSALRAHLSASDYSEGAVKSALRADQPTRLIGGLILEEVIRPHEHGWIVIGSDGDRMMLNIKGKK